MNRARWDVELAEREAQREAHRSQAAARVGCLTDRELDLVAAATYWCEGSKSKPWARREQLIIINSDEHYVGCLVIAARQTRLLYQEIEGLWRGIVAGRRGEDAAD